MQYSIIVPVYNEESLIENTYLKLKEIIVLIEKNKEDCELIFVNDGSRDKTEETLVEICKKDKKVKLINFSRNFGQEMAMKAGLNLSNGSAVITIDADLQDPPMAILQMIKMWKNGYLIVHGKRLKRNGETYFKKITSKIYHRILRNISNLNMEVDTGNFRLIDRKVCDIINGINDHNRYLRGLAAWVGFKQTTLEFDCTERESGKTKYSIKSLFRLALDGILMFSYKPITFFLFFGLSLFLISIATFFYILYMILNDNRINKVNIFLNLFLCLISVLFIALGVLGEYISKIYDEVKGTSPYIVSDTLNF